MKSALLPLVALASIVFADDRPAETETPRVAWGQIDVLDPKAQIYLARVEGTDVPREIEWPSPLPSAISAYRSGENGRASVPVVRTEAGRVSLRLPEGFASRPAPERAVVVEAIGEGGQRRDGRIVLSAADASLEPPTRRRDDAEGAILLEPGTAAGRAAWKYTATRPGTYLVEATYALPGEPAQSVRLELAGKVLEPALPATGDDVFSTHPCGTITIAGPGAIVASIACGKTAGIRLLGLTLRPACEGKPVVQKQPGEIVLHARDVIIRGVQVQYEPRPEKNTIGYWTNPDDQVAWEFTASAAGLYEVEILQGCGAGQGGSEVELSIGTQALRFVVKDTGHFQNFVPRVIGKVRLESRPQTLHVRPLRKAGIAVMDLRQVRLIPAE